MSIPSGSGRAASFVVKIDASSPTSARLECLGGEHGHGVCGTLHHFFHSRRFRLAVITECSCSPESTIKTNNRAP